MEFNNNIKTTPATVEFKLNIELSENEARAWDAIVGYGFEAFIKVFKENLGKSYIEPYEVACKKMFEDTKRELGFQLHAIDQVKKAIKSINNKDYLTIKK